MASCLDCIFYHHNIEYGQPFDECTNEYEEDFSHWNTTSIKDEGAEKCNGFCSSPEDAEQKYGD